MLQKKYKSKVISIKNPLKGLYELEFASLKGKYKYHPGQFLHIAFDEDYDGTGQWPESRCFSMQSNCEEKTLRITYTVKGEFTRLMEKTLKPGLEVWLKLPYGDIFSKPHDKANTVFIAGGTGITPFLSLFSHSSFQEYMEPNIYLGFRSKKHNIYQKELRMLEDKAIKIFYQDIDGVIDIHRIINENGTNSTYFISGPPEMIKVFRQTLIEKGVISENVLTDDWE